MAHNFAPTAAVLVTVPCPDDGDARSAASVNGAFEALGNGVFAQRFKRDLIVTDGATWTVPAGVTSVDVTMRAPGGGGGGGPRGNSANANMSSSCGGAGGGAGEIRRERLTVVPGDVLTFARGAVGTGGAGSATTVGTGGTAATNATLTSAADGVILVSRGGLGGTGGQRNVDAGENAVAVGGHSTGYPTDLIVAAKAAGATADLTPYIFHLSEGAGASTYAAEGGYAGFSGNTGFLYWSRRDGTFATNGAMGADDPDPTGKIGGGGGGGGGSTERGLGGAGGAGGDAVAGGAGLSGSVGTAAPADSGAGGGGGGAGGTGSSGAAGADGANGALGYLIFEYVGIQAVIA